MNAILNELFAPHAALPATGAVYANAVKASSPSFGFRFIGEPHVDGATLAADRMITR